VFPVWESGRHGEDVVISIVDDGVESAHPDLTNRIVPQAGYDYRDQDSQPEPEGANGVDAEGKPAADSHGTAVAGVAAASGNNGIGVAGAAYAARLVPIRLIGGNTGDDQEAKAMAHRLDLVHISNNSWGADDDGKTITAPGPLMKAALDTALSQGRGGLGTIFVWSAGNGGNEQDNANNDGYANHPGTIAVGALNDLGHRADYSEPGACLIVSAPSGNDKSRSPGSFTTDLLGERGYNRADVESDIAEIDYTSTFNGTSSAAPLVSGVVALMLQVNPKLGWRDVQEVLIRSAAMAQPENLGWFTNSAKIRFNHEFGAGRVDAAAAVQLASGWRNLGARRSAVVVKATKDLPPIPDEGVFEGNLLVTDELRVEQVTLNLTLTHPSRGELAIDLISPAGTISHLFVPHGDTNQNIEHRFTSVFQWGESARGDWKLRIRDTVSGNAGQVSDYRLEVFGTRSEVVIPDLKLTALGESSEGFRLRLQGPADRAVVLQASSDLIDWQVVTSGTIDGGDMQFADPTASETARFYRLVLSNP
jgi:subtilisin family serine protease